MSNIILKCVIALFLIESLTNASSLVTRDQSSDSSLRRQKSERMAKYMNQSVDPCEDFYEFVCGNYPLYNGNQALASAKVSVLDSITLETGKKLIEELDKDDDTDTEIDIKVKSFYRSCINTEINIAYARKLQKLPDEFGGMPVLKGDRWQEDDFNWWRTLAAIIKKTALPILFKVNVLPDVQNVTIPRVAIEEPALPLGSQKAYYHETAKPVREFIINNIAQNLKGYLGVETAIALQTAKEIFQFEKDLARGLMDFNQTEYMKMMSVLSNDEVDHKYMPYWNVVEFLRLILNYQPDNVMIQHKYVDNAFVVIKKTSIRVVANYIFYTYLAEFMRTSSTNRDRVANACKDITWRHLYKNLHNMLYRKYPAKEAEKVSLQMWDNLKNTLRNVAMSEEYGWIHNETRQNFLSRLTAMKLKINSFEDIDFVSEFAHFNPNANDYMANLRSLLAMAGRRLRHKLNEPPAYESDSFAATTPLYNPFENQVQMATTYLRSNYIWSKSYPNALNYATLGFTLAHEMVHGFDDVAMHYDLKGNSHDWWDPDSKKEFKQRIQCFIGQYHKYVFFGHTLPEIGRQSENIADNGGLHLAYEAYLEWYAMATESQQNMEVLPGFDYTDLQLFFIGYGQSMCSYWNPTLIDFYLMINHHSPEKVRVNVPLANFHKFAKVFNCPVGSSMNPLEKCKMY